MKVLVVGPGPVRPGVCPAASQIAADLADHLASEGHEVVAIDSSPTSALLWAKGAKRRFLEPLESRTLRRVAQAEGVEATIAHAAGPVVLRALTLEGDGGSWADASPSQLVGATRPMPVDLESDGTIVDVVAASDGEASVLLAAFRAGADAHVALADTAHARVDVTDAMTAAANAYFEAHRELGLTTLRVALGAKGANVIAVDRVDATLWTAAGLDRGVVPGALLGALAFGASLEVAMKKAARPARRVTERVPSFDFEPYPGVDRALGARPKSLGAEIACEDAPAKPKSVAIVGPGTVRAGHSAEASLATILAAREAERLGHAVTIVSTREGVGAARAIPEDASHVLVGFGADPSKAVSARAADIGEAFAAKAKSLEGAAPSPRAIELHVLVLSDGTSAKVVGTFEHVERASVHADDAAAVFPSLAVDESALFAAEERAVALAPELRVRGLYTARFAVEKEPTLVSVGAGVTTHALSLSLALGTDLVAEAVRLALGAKLDPKPTPLPRHVAVEEHVFPFAALGASDTRLDRRPRSTGTVLALGETVARAYSRALAAMGVSLRRPGAGGERAILLAGAEEHAAELADVGRRLYALGFELVATEEAARWLEKTRVPHTRTPDPASLVSRRGVVAIVATSDRGAELRRAALVAGVTCFTTVELVKVATKALELDDASFTERALEDWAAEG